MLKIGLGYIQIDFIKQIVKEKRKKKCMLGKVLLQVIPFIYRIGKISIF